MAIWIKIVYSPIDKLMGLIINQFSKELKYLPLILLYFSVLNEFDIDVPSIGLLSFNLPFIIIFYNSDLTFKFM